MSQDYGATHTASVWLYGKAFTLVRGWISWVGPGKRRGDVVALLQTDRFPGKTFRVYLGRKEKPFGAQRALGLRRDIVFPAVGKPNDLGLEPGDRVCFGVPVDSKRAAFPVVLEADYDRIAECANKRDFPETTVLRKGQHRWPDGV